MDKKEAEEQRIDRILGIKNLRPGPSKGLMDRMYSKDQAKEKPKIINYMCRNIEDNPLKWDQSTPKQIDQRHQSRLWSKNSLSLRISQQPYGSRQGHSRRSQTGLRQYSRSGIYLTRGAV